MPTSPSYAFARDARSNWAVNALLSLGFAALTVAAGAAFLVQQRIETEAAWVRHSLDVGATLNSFARQVERVETARRGALLDPDGDFLPIMRDALAEARGHLARARSLTRDNPGQQQRITSLARRLAVVDAYANASIARGAQGSAFRNDSGVRAIRELRRAIDQVIEVEAELLRRRSENQTIATRVYYAVMGIAAVLILAIGAATMAIVRRGFRAVERSRRELARMNEALEDLVEARTGQLRRANAEIQRFAYIVSHDLRSPLVNVMGFTAELETARRTIAGQFERMDEEGRPPPPDVRLAVAEDLPEAIESFAARPRRWTG